MQRLACSLQKRWPRKNLPREPPAPCRITGCPTGAQQAARWLRNREHFRSERTSRLLVRFLGRSRCHLIRPIERMANGGRRRKRHETYVMHWRKWTSKTILASIKQLKTKHRNSYGCTNTLVCHTKIRTPRTAIPTWISHVKTSQPIIRQARIKVGDFGEVLCLHSDGIVANQRRILPRMDSILSMTTTPSKDEADRKSVV